MVSKSREEKLERFQEFINYEFSDISLLSQALTTPEYGNQFNEPHYEQLETLGDAVAKLCFCVQLYENGTLELGKITQQKQVLESNKIFFEIAKKNEFWNYITYYNIANIEESSILADIFEAVIGAIFLDSGKNLKMVDEVIINKFIQNWEVILEQSTDFNKNELLNYLQGIYGITPKLKFKYIPFGPENAREWKATNPKILNDYGLELLTLPDDLESEICKTRKDAEKDIASKILAYLKKKK